MKTCVAGAGLAVSGRLCDVLGASLASSSLMSILSGTGCRADCGRPRPGAVRPACWAAALARAPPPCTGRALLGASLLLPVRLKPSPSWIHAKPSIAAVFGLLLRGSCRGAGGCGLLEAGARLCGGVGVRSHVVSSIKATLATQVRASPTHACRARGGQHSTPCLLPADARWRSSSRRSCPRSGVLVRDTRYGNPPVVRRSSGPARRSRAMSKTSNPPSLGMGAQLILSSRDKTVVKFHENESVNVVLYVFLFSVFSYKDQRCYQEGEEQKVTFRFPIPFWPRI